MCMKMKTLNICYSRPNRNDKYPLRLCQRVQNTKLKACYLSVFSFLVLFTKF